MQTGRPERIHLSVPHMGGREEMLVREAFQTNWMSTVGPHLGAFEDEFEQVVGRPSVAVSSGTAAIHLGLRLLGVGEGDEVFCQTLTFVASCNPVLYLGAKPVFVDSETYSWNLDPELLRDALKQRARVNRLPKALIVVHLFGQCADMDPIREICGRYEIPILEDAAEALGALYRRRPAGTLGDVAAFSFNGNKIITTTGGGMLVTARRDWADQGLFWATQAKDPGMGYEHSQVGYNYRMSNVLAGIGRGQLELLSLRVRQRRAVAKRYWRAFADVPGISPMPQANYGLHTNWLSCFLISESRFGCSRDELIRRLDHAGIEARRVWKPMHLQPVFADAECYRGAVAEDLFRRGICLPSSSSLSDAEQLTVIDEVRRAAGCPDLAEMLVAELVAAGSSQGRYNAIVC